MITRVTKRPAPRCSVPTYTSQLLAVFAVVFVVLLWYTSSPPATSMVPPVHNNLATRDDLPKYPMKPNVSQVHSESSESSESETPSLRGSSVNVSSSFADFGDLLWRQLAVRSDLLAEDLFISPLSVALCLMLLVNGAQGPTRDEVIRTLQLTESVPMKSINTGAKRLTKEIMRSEKVLIANSVWTAASSSIRFQKSYEKDVDEYYDAVSRVAHSVTDPNEWVSKHTRGKIASIVDELTELTLVNAFYFQADWETAFQPRLTRPRPFYRLNTATPVMVTTMSLQSHFSHHKSAAFEAIRLPYSDCGVHAVLVLPPENTTTIPSFAVVWKSLQAAPTSVTVQLPKFSAKSTTKLIPLLMGMSLKLPFEADADFRPMVQAPYPQGLRVASAVHHAAIEVDEKGTEAAAATTIGIHRSAVVRGEVMRCNRPFHFFLVHNTSGLVLFRGIVMRPKEVRGGDQ